MLQMHTCRKTWDFKDQLQSTQQQVVNTGSPETNYYVYDSAGQRVRKVTANSLGTRSHERIYLHGFEVYRGYIGGSTVALELQTVHVMDDKRRVAMIETKTVNVSVAGSPPLTSVFHFRSEER
jgi:hypothetical protein